MLRSPLTVALVLAPVLALGSCSSSNLVPTGAALLQDIHTGGALVVHPVYAPTFEALRDALDVDDLTVARATLGRLRGRLDRDLETAPTREQAVADMPTKEHVESALTMADGFERVIEGRVRLASTDLFVELQRVAGEELVDVTLIGESRWHTPLTVRPGLGTLEVLRTSIEPRTGVERRETQRIGLQQPLELDVPAGGRARLHIMQLPIEVPKGVIATRMRVDLGLNGGSVQDGDVVYPARRFDCGAGRRTDLAGFVPASLVNPGELVRLFERGGAPVAALVERAVRIDPARHDEALDGLGRVARTLPVDAIEPLVPALRWLAHAEEFGRDAGLWRTWLVERYESRVAAGEL